MAGAQNAASGPASQDLINPAEGHPSPEPNPSHTGMIVQPFPSSTAALFVVRCSNWYGSDLQFPLSEQAPQNCHKIKLFSPLRLYCVHKNTKIL